MGELIDRSELLREVDRLLRPYEKEAHMRAMCMAKRARIAVMDLIQHQPAVADKMDWISVAEGMPEKWRDDDGTLINYFVFMPEYGVDVGNWLGDAKLWVCMGLPVKVTHWMQLPEPPKEHAHD